MKNKIKVLLVSPYSGKKTGGIGTWSKILLDYSIDDEDVDLHFLNTATRLPKRWAMSNRITHLIVGGVDSLRILFELVWKMFLLQPEVVHYTSSAGSALRKDLIAIRVVKTIYKKNFVIHWHFGRIPLIIEKREEEYNQLIEVCKKSDISITIDARSFRSLKQEGLNVVYVPNPIPKTLQQKTKELDKKRLSEKRVRGEVLFVGHVLKGKGVYELVKACVECEEVKRLIIIGPFFDENVKKELTELAEKRDKGNWLLLAGEKSREEVWNYYTKCSVFCLPSYSEGFPYVILEAMAYGCPIVATKVGAIPEMLEEGCGRLIEVRSESQLKYALQDLLSDRERALAMGERAHEKVLNNYTITKVYTAYKDVWKTSCYVYD